jgi:hypothetical protein
MVTGEDEILSKSILTKLLESGEWKKGKNEIGEGRRNG